MAETESVGLVPLGTFPDLDALEQEELQAGEGVELVPATSDETGTDLVLSPESDQLPAPIDTDAGTDAAEPPALEARADADAEVTEPWEPWSFHADGKEVALPGAAQTTDGVWIPRTSLRQLQSHLADRAVWRQKEQGYQAQVQALQPDRHPDVLLARQMYRELAGLLDRGPEAVAAFLHDYVVQRPLLEARAQLAATVQQRAQLQSQEAARIAESQAAADWADLEPRLPQHLWDNLVWYSQQPGYEALAHENVLRDLHSRLMRLPHEQLFVEAVGPNDLGLQPGEIDVNRGPLEQWLQLIASHLADLQTVATAQAHNQRALGKTATPPTPSARGSAARTATQTPSTPKTKDEWEAWFQGDGHKQQPDEGEE